MPTVPTYQDTQQRVFLQPRDAHFQIDADPDANGAAIGRGLEALSTGVGDLGDAVTHVQDLDNANASKDALNKYADWSRNAMYGDGGFMTLEGSAAVQGRANFEEQAAQKRVEFGADLNPGANKYYMDASQAHLNSILGQSIEHTATERKAWFTDTSNATVEKAGNDALAAYKNPTLVNQNLLVGINELKQQQNMHGWSPEVFDQKKQDFVSGVTAGIVKQMAVDDPIAAQQYMKDAGNRLNAAAQFELSHALETPVLQAKAQRNVANIVGGAPTPDKSQPVPATIPGTGSGDLTGKEGGFALINNGGPTRITSPSMPTPTPTNPNGATPFQQVTSHLLGLNEHDNAGAISQFIKQSAGLNVDPRVTPWCAGFVNAVLGAEGIKGTGSLAARSFMQFGSATTNPKVGDIVVFGRGDPDHGHVGFFQGYDANGRILVLGGNQGKDGRVSVSSEGTANLLGFRTAGPVNENTATLPNYTPQGLAHIQDQLNTITDPKERAATEKALDGYYDVQKKQMDMQRDAAMQQATQAIMSNPGMSVTSLPLDVQTAAGASGMSSLMGYQDALRRNANPVTDPHTLLDLQTQYATDPNAFAQQDLWQYKPMLSNEDWGKVTDMKQTALTNQRKALEDGANISQAFNQADTQLTAVGLAANKPSEAGGENDQRRAKFKLALSDQISEFQKTTGKKPTQAEQQGMINRMLLPIVITTPGTVWNSTRNAFQFEANGKQEGETVKTAVQIKDIPGDQRERLSDYLERTYRRKPTDAEVVGAYVRFVNGN
jgi:uncharacterized protein (TIGR02594 family)